MKFFKALMGTFMANIVVLILGILVNVVSSRWLGPTGRGVLGLSNNLVAFFLIILDLGVGASNTYFVGKNKKNVNYVIGCDILIIIIELIFIPILYVLSLHFNIAIFKGLSPIILVISLITIPFSGLKSALTNVVLGIEEYKQYNKLNIVNQIFNLILLVIFLKLFNTVFYVLISNLVVMFIMILFLVFFIIHKKKYTIAFSLSVFKSMVRYGVKAQLSNLVQLLTYRLDIFIVGYFLTLTSVGLYTNAVALAELMWQIPGTVATLMYPAVSNSEDKEYIKTITNRTTRICLVVILFCSLCLALISKPLILILYGSKFSGSVNPLLLLIPGIAFFSVSKILASSIAGMGRIDINLKVSVIICALTVVLDFILIPLIGINGASIATSITYILHSVITLYYYNRLTGSKISDVVMLNELDINEIKNQINLKFKRNKK